MKIFNKYLNTLLLTLIVITLLPFNVVLSDTTINVGTDYSGGYLTTSSDKNSWQIVDQKYVGYDKNKISSTPNNNFRVQESVAPTDVENEFLVYMSIDMKDVYESYFDKSEFLATPSNSVHADQLGDFVATMQGNQDVKVIADNSTAGYKKSAFFTIKDFNGKVLFDNQELFWSQGDNCTIFLKLNDGSGYILLGISVKSGKDNNAVNLSKSATEHLYESIKNAQSLKISNSNETTGFTLGDKIEFLSFTAGDTTHASFDSNTNSIIWNPGYDDTSPIEEITINNKKEVWHLNASQLVFRVRLKTEIDGFKSCANNMDSTIGEVESYIVNNPAVLYEKSADGTKTYDTVTFQTPHVRGLLYDTPVIVKTDTDGNPLAGAKFALTRTTDFSSNVKAEKYVYELEVDSTNPSKFRFYGVPYGTYTITEIQAPTGYIANQSIPNLTFSFTDNPAAYEKNIENESDMKLLDSTAILTNGELIVENEEDPNAKTSLNVVKVWDDYNNKGNTRPSKLKIQLFANGTASGEPVEINETGDWKYTFSNLPLTNDGIPITYSAKEYDSTGTNIINEGGKFDDNYSVSYGTLNDTTTITNKYRKSIKVNKEWKDNNNQDGKRTESITIQLYADGTAIDEKQVELSASNNWSHIFTGLDVYKNDKEIEYTVKETNVPDGYTEEDIVNDDGSLTVENTHTPETTSIDVTKVWDDASNQDGKRPDGVTIQLYKNDVAITDATLTLNSSNEWKGSFADLDVYTAGKKNTYTVKETDTPTGYSVTYEPVKTGEIITGCTVTNKHEIEKISIPVTKTWEDANNQDGKRPSSITVRLMNGETEVANSTIQADTDGIWEHTFTDLPKYSNGTEIKYSVTEDAVEGYTTTYDGFNIKNSYTHETTSVTATKKWIDNSNQDGIRPAKVTINLLADGSKTKSLEATESNDWEVTFDNLPKYKNGGTEIVYTVTEDTVSGYTPSIDGYEITNTHTPETISIPVTKSWSDADNQDGIRPESITVRLMNGTAQVDTATIQEDTDGNWKHTFTNLPKYSDGTEIKYSVTEDAIENYTPTITGDAANGFTITNTHTPEKTSISVTKEWTDADNQDGIRPNSVTVKLLSNGVDTGKTLTLSLDNGWTDSFKDLDVYISGTKNTYTVEEENVTSYTSVVTGDVTSGFNIENTHTPATTSITVTKEWDDNNNQDGKRPSSIGVQLFANNEAIEGKTLTLDDSNSWTGTFSDLDVNKAGEAIAYRVEEVMVPAGYTVEITGNMTEGFVVKNSHTPETKKLTINKVWYDNENADSKRPSSIKIQVLKSVDGGSQSVVETKELTSWSYETDALPVYEGGKLIDYVVRELDVDNQIIENDGKYNDDYVATYVVNGNTTTITNEYIGRKIDINVEIVFKDNDNIDKVRPTQITIVLYKDGEIFDTKVIPVGEDNNYTFTFENLYASDNGTPITYTISEDAIDFYNIYITGNIDDGFVVNNIHNHKTPEYIPPYTGIK